MSEFPLHASPVFVVRSFMAFYRLVLAPAANAQTERPPTEQLLPETTVGYIKIANIRDMVEKVSDPNGEADGTTKTLPRLPRIFINRASKRMKNLSKSD